MTLRQGTGVVPRSALAALAAISIVCGATHYTRVSTGYQVVVLN
jgi:hypothetical protein